MLFASTGADNCGRLQVELDRRGPSTEGIVTEGGDLFFTGLRRRFRAVMEPGPEGKRPAFAFA